MVIEKRSLGWLPKQSLYDQQESARTKISESNSTFLETQSSFADSFATIQSDALTGTAELVTKIAVARITDKTA